MKPKPSFAPPPPPPSNQVLHEGWAPTIRPESPKPSSKSADGKFRYHKPSLTAVVHIESVRAACRALEAVLLEHVPVSREQSLAITNLEQVSMWANKGIVINDPESTVLTEPG